MYVRSTDVVTVIQAIKFKCLHFTTMINSWAEWTLRLKNGNRSRLPPHAKLFEYIYLYIYDGLSC